MPLRPGGSKEARLLELKSAVDDLWTRVIRFEVGVGILAALGLGGVAFSTLTAPDVAVESKRAEQRLRSLSDSVNQALETYRVSALADITRMYVEDDFSSPPIVLKNNNVGCFARCYSAKRYGEFDINL